MSNILRGSLLSVVVWVASAYQLHAAAIISAGNVMMGVDDYGQLNVAGGPPSPVLGTTVVGVRYTPTGNEATAHGCLCEGWGVSDGITESYANNACGVTGLGLVSFSSTGSTALSVVKTSDGKFRVTHDYQLSGATSDLYEVKVTIEALTAVPTVLYRRNMDWDVEPTAFSEFSTIQGWGLSTNLIHVSNDGFTCSGPLIVDTLTGCPIDSNFVDCGPADHGALFDFDFGPLPAGGTKTFTIFYGASATEVGALTALTAAGCSIYSLGQPSTPTGDTVGDPNTFIFGFQGVGEPDTGACCDFSFKCYDGLTQDECEAAPYLGTFQGVGTTCATIDCVIDPTFDESCCLPDGMCLNSIPQDECELVLGGFYVSGFLCGTFECAGACCLPYCNPPCLDPVTLSDCELIYGGWFGGVGSTCDDVSCTGACCLPDGTCLPNYLACECEAIGGNFLDIGSPCPPEPCSEPTGACCSHDCVSPCVDNVTQDYCENTLFGIYGGDYTKCTDLDCSGACCLQDGTCVTGYLFCECEFVGGQFFGLGSPCPPEPCDEPSGACCNFENCTCTDGVTELFCELDGGVYLGDGTTCLNDVCDGACCLPDGSCVENIIRTDCENQGGTYFGCGSVCEPEICNGACCYPDGNCYNTNEPSCDAACGIWYGVGSICPLEGCPSCDDCRPDIDCPNAAASVYQAGAVDNYCSGTDSAIPGTAMLQTWSNQGVCVSPKDFDDPTTNRCFGHTFTGLPSNIAAATLCVHARADQFDSLACNDSINLQANTALTGFTWGSRFGNGGSCTPVTQSLISTPWQNGADEVFCLNLASLPTTGAPINLLASMNATGRLDVYIQDDTEVDYLELKVITCEGCVDPPPNMEAWWPMDSLDDDTAVVPDIVNGHNGTPVNGASPAVGYVAGAYLFDGVDDSITVPHSPGLDVGCGDWSYDAWIKWNGVSSATIVSKYGFNSSSIFNGYSWFVDTTGQLCVELESELQIRCVLCSTAAVAPNTWTHVAVTFAGSGLVTFYINGATVGSFNTGCICFTNTGPVIIGDGGLLSDPFGGLIDELEFFRRVLGANEINDIYDAGTAGKCKEHCHVDWDIPICTNQTSVVANMQVCNDGTTSQTYNLSFIGLPVNLPYCTIAGPTSFTILSSNPVTVAPGTCATITVKIDRPPGANINAACFDLIAQNAATGHLLVCHGSLWLKDKICGIYPDDLTPIDVPIQAVFDVTFDVFSDVDQLVIYQFEVMPSDMNGPNQAVRLNGLPPGVPVEGFLDLSAGEIQPASVDVSIVEYEAFRWYDLVLSTDEDGDGIFEAVMSTGLRAAVPCEADLIAEAEDFAGPAPGWSFLEDAEQTGGEARLVHSGHTFKAGGAAFDDGYTTEAFEVEFDFEMTNVAGGVPDGSGDPDPDGLALVISGEPVVELGFNGFGLGYKGFPTESFATEIDTFKNFVAGQPPDPDGNHVGLDVGGSVNSIATAFVATDFDETGLWHARVLYESGDVTVFLTAPGDAEAEVLSATIPPVNIPAVKYFALTSGTGANSADTDADNVVIRLLDAGCDRDCNGNGILDATDIADGTSLDVNSSDVPDECEVPPPPCEGDANGDGTVDPLDSGFVLARLGCPVGTGDPGCDSADQNGDGAVDPLDVGYVLARFGPCS